MSNSISSSTPPPSWENIKEKSLEDKNLTADIRLGDKSVDVNAPGIVDELKIDIGLEQVPDYPSREETLANLQDHFDVYFSKELCRLVAETGIHSNEAKYKELVAEAMKQSKSITQKLTTTIVNPGTSTSQAIQEAHLGALNSLDLLRKQFAQPQQTPQFCVTKEGKISVLQPAPHPENLVLSGGGVKGVGYVGWFKAAEGAGALKAIKRLAGSSAGAITAALMASGMSADDFEKASKRTNFFSILTGTSRDVVVQQDTNLEPAKWFSSFRGTYAVDHVNQEMVGSIKKYFKTLGKGRLGEKIKDPILELSENDKTILLNLEKAITPPPRRSWLGWLFSKKQPEQPTHMVTFKELALLAKVDSRFKELTVTGYDSTKQKEIYYNAQDSPDQKIAEAVRTSMSVPVIFQPVVDLNSGDVLEDGGVGSNIPTEVFIRDRDGEENVEQARAKTLVLGFDNNGRFYDITSKGVIHKPVERGSAFLSGNPRLQEDSDADAQKLYDAGPNATLVEHGDLNMTSFMASEARLNAAQLQAEVRATEAFSLRQNQAELKSMGQAVSGMRNNSNNRAIDALFASLKDAMRAMTSPELENIAKYYRSNSDGKDLLSEQDRSAVSQAAQDELATRHQKELELSA